MLVVFDLDGTLADCSHRQHLVTGPGKKNWKMFFELIPYDTLIYPVYQIYDAFACHIDGRDDEVHTIVICTARPEDYKVQTIKWMVMNNIESFDDIYFRKSGDYRDDTIVKKEMLDQIIKDYGKKPDLVFDDRKRVVDMWRENGIQCCQVAPGEF